MTKEGEGQTPQDPLFSMMQSLCGARRHYPSSRTWNLMAQGFSWFCASLDPGTYSNPHGQCPPDLPKREAAGTSFSLIHSSHKASPDPENA